MLSNPFEKIFFQYILWKFNLKNKQGKEGYLDWTEENF